MGGREIDSHVDLARATLPKNPLGGADRTRILLVNCGYKPNGELHRTCRDNVEQHLAWEPAISQSWEPPIRWEAVSRIVQQEVVIANHTDGYIQHVAIASSNVLTRGLTHVFHESRNASRPTPAQNRGRATLFQRHSVCFVCGRASRSTCGVRMVRIKPL